MNLHLLHDEDDESSCVTSVSGHLRRFLAISGGFLDFAMQLRVLNGNDVVW